MDLAVCVCRLMQIYVYEVIVWYFKVIVHPARLSHYMHVTLHACHMQGRLFTYDHVFQPNATQQEVYATSAKPLVQGQLEYNIISLCSVGTPVR